MRSRRRRLFSTPNSQSAPSTSSPEHRKEFRLLNWQESANCRLISPFFTSLAFSCNPLEQFGRRFVLRVLLDQLPPHREVEDEPAQARNGVGRFADAVEMGKKRSAVHRSSAFSRIALSWSRRAAVSFSAASSLPAVPPGRRGRRRRCAGS